MKFTARFKRESPFLQSISIIPKKIGNVKCVAAFSAVDFRHRFCYNFGGTSKGDTARRENHNEIGTEQND